MRVGNTVSMRRALAALVLAAMATATQAQATGPTQADATRWTCHAAEQHLVCRLAQAAATLPTTAPADPRLPPIVHTLRQQPASWRGRTVRIPLFNEPYGDSSLQPLAQAVLCGPIATCRAEMRQDAELDRLALLDFADANDPLLQPVE